jgi:hypothetical protein
VPAGIQHLKVGDAVDAQHHRLAVDHEALASVLERGFHDPGIAPRPVMAVPGKQPNAVAITVNDQAEAVVFDFVNPFRRRRDRLPAGRDAGLESAAHSAADRH